MIWGARKFFPKNDLKVAWQINLFSVQIEVISKKKKTSLRLRRLFLSKLGWSPKKKRSSIRLRRLFLFKLGWSKKKKEVFTHIETVFLSSARNILVGKLAQTIWNRPKFWRKIAQNIWNCPKFCPKFRHLTPTGGSSAPPPAPPPLTLMKTIIPIVHGGKEQTCSATFSCENRHFPFFLFKSRKKERKKKQLKKKKCRKPILAATAARVNAALNQRTYENQL